MKEREIWVQKNALLQTIGVETCDKLFWRHATRTVEGENSREMSFSRPVNVRLCAPC
jgi:hypothetical protein